MFLCFRILQSLSEWAVHHWTTRWWRSPKSLTRLPPGRGVSKEARGFPLWLPWLSIKRSGSTALTAPRADGSAIDPSPGQDVRAQRYLTGRRLKVEDRELTRRWRLGANVGLRFLQRSRWTPILVILSLRIWIAKGFSLWKRAAFNYRSEETTRINPSKYNRSQVF